MVVKVYGTSNGIDIIFTPSETEEDTWICSVPPSASGEYVVDLYAEDEFGNKAYTATVLFAIDIAHLDFRVHFIKYSADARMRKFAMKLARCKVCGGDKYGGVCETRGAG